MLTPDILKERLKNFWGYGSFDAPIWFVGMEEGFRATSDVAANEKMLERQFLLPTVNGMFDASRPFDRDIRDLTNLSPFLPNATTQSTWKFPIALAIFLQEGRRPDKNDILDFQRFTLADVKKNTASTLELMPLPSPNTSSWLYGGILGFETREAYLQAYKKERAQGLKNLVQKYSPKLVIFYSIGYLRTGEWVDVIGKMPEEITHQMYFTKTEKTSFCVIPQGASFGMSYDRLYEFAEKIKGNTSIF